MTSSGIPRISFGILSKKSSARILILGPYKPPTARAKLTKVKDSLNREGYAQAFLLENLPFRDPLPDEGVDVYFAMKGRDYLRNWADIALFIFMCETNNMGVLSEFDFTQYNLPTLSRTSTVFIDENCSFPSLTTSGTIVLSGVNQRTFRKAKDLCRAARAECLNHLRTLY